MVEFAGWQMPVQYQGALKEHLAVRKSVGVFDVSHMGELEIKGPDAFALIQRITCNDASKMIDGQAQYSAFLYPQGTFVDDIVVYRMSSTHYLICVNAANKDKDFAWVLEQKEGEVSVQDTSDHYVQLAIQGRNSASVLQQLTDLDLASLKFYRFTTGHVAGIDSVVSRTGYTGEDGFELYFSPEGSVEVWTRLFEAGRDFGIVPAGLAARNTLRLEMKYSLYGNDIDDTTTPLESGLGWIVKLSKADFIGKEALVQQKNSGLGRRLVGFEMAGRGIARDNYPVLLDTREIGRVNSGSFGPSVQKAIGMTYLPAEASKVGQRFQVEIRGKKVDAVVVDTPFYRGE
jgi:aminomethyltransferase